jgi:tellurite resistance protein TerC
MLLAWIALAAFVAAALALDLRGHGGKPMPTRTALVWSLAWTAIGVAFALVVLLIEGSAAASEYLAGFLIEKSLSLDNLFAFAILFAFFKVPDHLRLKVLVWGIGGAIVLRTAFILVGAAALDAFHATTYVLGALLLVTAVRIARQTDEQIDPDHTLAMRALRRMVPLSREYDGKRMFTRTGGTEAGGAVVGSAGVGGTRGAGRGRLVATPLLAALAMVAAFDVMFAIDSIPAIFAITRETFVVFAANAFSLLGMVSLYFLLDGMLDRFRYLNVGLAAILGFVAAKLLLADVWHPPIALSLGVIVLALLAAALASVAAERRDARRSGAAEAAAQTAAKPSDSATVA